VERRTHDLQASNEKLQNTINTLSSTQKELIQAGKMASLGSLVAGISHEINTPIGISVTSASSLQDEVRRLRMEFDQGSMKRSSLEQYMIHADEASDILLRNLKRAAEIVRSFKQVAVDQTSDESRSINLHAYVDEIILSLHPYLKRTSLQVVNICDENITINTLPGAIYQIISNFVMNSIIHAYDPGQVGFIKISARMLGDDIMLEYSDDGKGVPAQNIKQVFDPFFTTRREQGGSGLGLNIVYNLVTNSLQGTISIESNSGSGTGFKIRFPAILHQE
jgi:signal transduction histidine kinase